MDNQWACFWSGLIGLAVGSYGWYWLNRAKDLHITWLESRLEYWHGEYVQMRDKYFEEQK